MKQSKLGSESGRIWAGMGGVLLMAAGAVLVAMVAFSTESPARKVQIAEASHDTITQAQLEEFDELGNVSVTFCHTEGSGDQHIITTNLNAFLVSGHFSAEGNPLHEAGGAHDFVISIEVDDDVTVINDDTCGAATATATATQPVATATATQPVATATSALTPEATNTAVPTNTAMPTNTAVPTNTPPIATATAALTPEATNTAVPTATEAVPPTNTPQPTATTAALLPANTPTATPPALAIAEVQAVQATPVPPAAVLGVQATPPPVVRALPATGSGGYEDSSMALIIGVAMILAGTSISLVAMKRRA